MKRFSASTILGLTFGVLLAFGVAVSAFQSPTSPPPAGNVPASLNVGPATQTKEGGLNITGEVRTNNLCIGGACRGSWPVELQSTDVVAAGASRQQGPWYTACNQPSDSGRRCDAYWFFYYAPWTDWGPFYNPRGVLSASYSQATMPCYEIPNGSSNSCGPKRTYPVFSNFSCSGGFVVDTNHLVADSVDKNCEQGGWITCSAAVCHLP